MPLKKLKLSDFTISEGEETLHCPACGGAFLSQRRIEVFERVEDEQLGTHVSIDGQDVHINRSLEGNPSIRRHGLIIHFNCEECPADIRMKVYQHKGNTFVGMEYDDKS